MFFFSERSRRILKQIKNDLNMSEGAVSDNMNIIGWANQLAQAALESKDWFEIQTVTIQFLAAAQENKDKMELIAANILHRLALIMTDNPPNNNVEDSYAHNIISALFDSVFRSDPILSYQWANGFLRKSSQYKPDFVVFVQHSKDRYDIGVSEIKSPSNSNCNNNGVSDTVKIGKEMAWMLNTLIREGVEQPVVCGILLRGLIMTTFKMNLLYPQTYRLIELSSINLFESLQGISVLPTILRNIIQVKVRSI
ncbi:hypothetical protein K501DRAFT_168684 [Backusella circina FSU 941]|nr:hypothetical protein K501DRAFT_168684 [Backusella circina FSU 941]